MESVEQYRTVSSPMKKNPNRKRVIGLRVSSDSTQGGRKYMEDMICIVFDREQDADYACFAVFDGHGGKEAAVYARDHLWKNIKEQDGFFSREPGKVMYAIQEAFRVTQEGMWKERPSWPKTLSGYPSTAGTTCSMVIICGTDMYTAHVGDSRIVLGKSKMGSISCNSKYIPPNERIIAEMLTVDHKPSDAEEIERIESAGGRVQDKAGVQRVVWSRPSLDHTGPITRNTELTDIPFLAVARSLGDLWSYNFKNGQYIVSPEPDISHRVIDPHSERFLILGSDGLWNMVTSEASVQIVEKYDMIRAKQGAISTETVSHQLVKRAMDLWNYHLLRADNISVISVFFEYPEVIDDEGDQIDLDSVKEWQNIGLKIEGEEDNKEVDENGDNFNRPALIRRHACTKLTSMENYNRLYCMSNKERRQYGSIPAPQYKRRYTDGLELPKSKKQKSENVIKKENGIKKLNVGDRTGSGDKIYKVIHTKKCGIRVEYAYDPDAEAKKSKQRCPPKNNPKKTIMTKSGPIEVEYAYDVEAMKRSFEDTPTKVKAKRTFMTKNGPIEVLYECKPPTPGRNARSAPPKKISSRRSPRRRLSLDDNVVMGSRLTRSATKRSKIMNMHMTRARRASMKGKFAQMYNEMPSAQKAVKMR